jgi:hypothetical protein
MAVLVWDEEKADDTEQVWWSNHVWATKKSQDGGTFDAELRVRSILVHFVIYNTPIYAAVVAHSNYEPR